MNLKEKELIQNQKSFNRNGNLMDEVNLKINFLTEIAKDHKDTFLNNLFAARNKLQAKSKRLTQFVSDREQENLNLSQQIKMRQVEIHEITNNLQDKKDLLTDLQLENIEIRNEIQAKINQMRKNVNKIQATEGEINNKNNELKLLSESLVNIANEMSRQHIVYKKSMELPLNEIDLKTY